MAQTRGTFGSLYDNVDKAFFSIMKDRLSELPRIYTKTFAVKTSNRKFERVVSYVPFGDTLSKPEGEPYVMDTLREGYTKDFTHTENGLGFEVTQTAFEDDARRALRVQHRARAQGRRDCPQPAGDRCGPVSHVAHQRPHRHSERMEG